MNIFVFIASLIIVAIFVIGSAAVVSKELIDMRRRERIIVSAFLLALVVLMLTSIGVGDT